MLLENSDKLAQAGKLRPVKIVRTTDVRFVGTVHSLKGLKIARRIQRADMDILEIRVDALIAAGLSVGQIEAGLKRLELPLLITVRDPDEGGCGKLSLERRRELMEKFLPYASLVDVELRGRRELKGVVARAKKLGVSVICSDHDFMKTPSVRWMASRQCAATDFGADVYKIASWVRNARSVRRLLQFLNSPGSGARAVMGMGPYGKESRVVLALEGSALNYGFLDEPNAAGQWEARELKQVVRAAKRDFKKAGLRLKA